MTALWQGLQKKNTSHRWIQVFTRLEQAGFLWKKSRCSLLATEVQYLGHKMDTQSIHVFSDTLKAVHDAPAPMNVTELRSYLDIVNHYGRFLPDLAIILAPMYQLLKKDAKWKRVQSRQESFNCIKQISCSPVVVHYSTNKPLVLICDASPYDVGAVVAHRMEDGSERLIAYHSRSLSGPEKINYAQIDLEALAIISGLTKFNQYIWGRPVSIVTDYKLLLGLLGPNKPVPQMISPRMQCWALKLSSFEYDLVYRPGPSIPEADALSHLPAGPAPINVPNREIPYISCSTWICHLLHPQMSGRSLQEIQYSLRYIFGYKVDTLMCVTRTSYVHIFNVAQN